MLAITYTGLGYVGELRTDDWIVEVLDQNKAVNRDVGFVVGQFTEFASRAWSDLPAVERAVRHTFVMAGFHSRGKRQIPYVWTITNEDRNGAVVERFRAEYARAKSLRQRSLRLPFFRSPEQRPRWMTAPSRHWRPPSQAPKIHA